MHFTITGANGRVGKVLLKEALKDGHQVKCVLKKGESTSSAPFCSNILESIEDTDIVIDFTTPESAIEFANACHKQKKPFVTGTTGFSNEQINELTEIAYDIPVLCSSNMSLGINLLMKLAKESAAVLGKSYDVEIVEAHHRHKVDAPSGTALMTGRAIADVLGENFDEIKDLNRQQEVRPRKQGSIGFSSIRAGNLTGNLDVMFANDSEILEIKHQTMNRTLYAQGAVKAALWLLEQKPGKLYHTQDMLDYL